MCEIDHRKGFWVKYSIVLALKHFLHPDIHRDSNHTDLSVFYTEILLDLTQITDKISDFCPRK